MSGLEATIIRAIRFARRSFLILTQRWGPQEAIAGTAKGHLEFVQALSDLGLDLAALQSVSVGVYRVGMSWPLEPRSARDFCTELNLVPVIEDKRRCLRPS